MAKLYLIRHAQSENNAIWDGSDEHPERRPDPEITETGHQQARTLAEHLAHPQMEPRQHPFLPVKETHFGLTHVYCSLMTRSILTAEYVSKACDLELQAHAEIFEKHGIFDVDSNGNLQGLPGPDREYFGERFPRLKLPQEFNDDGWWNRSAEDESAFLQRMRSVVNEIRQRLTDSDDCIALVAHGDFIDQFVNELMGVVRHQPNYDNHWVANWTFHNTSISRIDFVNGAHNVVYMNRIDHLPNELVTW
ncbi:MAG: histidine phosphatase family protein [Gammaproteobacteria bacterium]|nr:histidine phosphatase family protein [Gammaproteobacteria bacterium]MCP4874850.1 histidine phosphatase family protein [Gammaproteobacteria bacterium]MCP4982094.1 histidine phosphatase family protein [Gammaproteobacteria bacterium]